MEQQTKKANHGPLGLIGFGMTTVLLNLHNAGVFKTTVMIAAMGFALGGLAQIIAGLFEFKNGNTFGGTAFTAYGCFWWSLVLIWWNPLTGAESAIHAVDNISMGFYLSMWGLFTAFMFIGALKHNNITKIVFGTLTVLFTALAIAFFTEVNAILVTAGVIGIICGLCAFYSAVAQIINEEYGKKIFPT